MTDSLNDPGVLQAVENAVADVLRGRGFMLEGLVVCVDAITPDGKRAYLVDSPDDQLHWRTIAILDHALAIQHEIRRLNICQTLIDSDEDDDDD